MIMKFGLMYEIQVREPHYEGIEQERYKQVMAQAELADQVGFDHFWTVEHHFLREFSHCSAPEVLYGAISQRTKRIRIGHAVALLPGQYNHPVRVAERAAVLDIVSDGRMDLGTGRSATLIEMDAFQVDPEETKEQWEEAVRMIPRMWTEDPFSHEGRFYVIQPWRLRADGRANRHLPGRDQSRQARWEVYQQSGRGTVHDPLCGKRRKGGRGGW